MKDKKRILKDSRKILLCIILAAVCFAIKTDVYAEANLLTHTEIKFFAGDTVKLRDIIDEEYLNQNYDKDYNDKDALYTITYKWNEQNLNPENAALDAQGVLTVSESCTLYVDITFEYGDKTHKEVLTVSVLAPEEISLIYSGEQTLLASTVYDDDKYSYVSKDESVKVEAGKATVQGFTDTVVYAKNEVGKNITVANITIEKPSFEKEQLARAVGSAAFVPVINDYEPFEDDVKPKWEVEDTSFAAYTDDGLLAKKKGETKVNVELTAKNGEKLTLSANLYLTKPSLSLTEIVMASGLEKKLSVKGTCKYSEIDWKTRDGQAYFKEDGVVYGNTRGKKTLQVVADGLTLKCVAYITDPVFKSVTIVSHKGKTHTIKLNGLNASKSVVTYKAKNKSMATVTKKGFVRSKKVGHAYIDVNADGRKITIPVEIATKKAYSAAKKAVAISKTKTKYSQAMRMSKGKYDCSSLVWRIYKNFGYYFGTRGSWAPVAADIGKWCVRNKKVVSKKGVPYTKLLPGDLIFYSFSKNGRYKNITHVEMYTGHGMDVSASSSNNRVINYEYYNSSSIVLIARPTK